MENKAQLEIVFKDYARPLPLNISWTLRQSQPDAKRSFQAIDLILKPVSLLKFASYDTLLPHNVTQIRQVFGETQVAGPSVIISNQVVCRFFLKALQHCLHGGSRAIQLIYPNNSGWIVRSDFLERRLVDCPLADTTVGFVSPLQQVVRPDLSQLDFTGLLAAATGAVLLHPGSEPQYQKQFEQLIAELDHRISFPWLLPHPIGRRRVAFVHKNKELWPDEPLVLAVAGLGYDLVILAQEGHWYTRPGNRHLIEGFVKLDVTDDEGLPERIVTAVRSYEKPIEGIFSFNEAMHVPLSQAAELLGLPSTPSNSYELVSDKYATRQLTAEDGPPLQSLCFADGQELRSSIEAGKIHIEYPVIVKPTKGTSSEGVFKVGDQAQLIEAASKTFGVTQRRSGAIVVETFIDGPEFDANFIIADGEVLFFELLDDYPSSGDDHGNTGLSARFMEIGMITPSALPEAEIEVIKAYLHKAILRAGFRWGIFHVEGRVRDSSVQYAGNEDGIWDLRPIPTHPPRTPSTFLLEINARAPGIVESFMSIRTYGIDYFGLQTLVSLRDGDRLRALSQPFLYPGGYQYHSEVVLFSPSMGGVCQTPDPCEDLFTRHPELRSSVAVYHAFYKQGDRVPSPLSGTMVFLAFIVVFSRKSRLDVQETANKIRKAWRIEII